MIKLLSNGKYYLAGQITSLVGAKIGTNDTYPNLNGRQRIKNPLGALHRQFQAIPESHNPLH
jgi:hypothetical protein